MATLSDAAFCQAIQAHFSFLIDEFGFTYTASDECFDDKHNWLEGVWQHSLSGGKCHCFRGQRRSAALA